MVILVKIRKMHSRDGLPLCEIAKRTGLSCNTIRHWLRSGRTARPIPGAPRCPGSIPISSSW